MAKLKDDPITSQHMADFVASDSDFAFEMRVLAELTALGFACSHSGTYRDPVTEKIRQFDIRAVQVAGGSQLSIAVECKNLRLNFPLLISAIPRTNPEAFHDQITINRDQGVTYIKTRQVSSAYKAGEMVGKKSDQVGRDYTSGALLSNDETTFENDDPPGFCSLSCLKECQ